MCKKTYLKTGLTIQVFLMMFIPTISPGTTFLTEGFNSAFTGAPSGWSRQFLSGDNEWVAAYGDLRSETAPHSGAGNALFYYEYMGIRQTYLITPAINFPPGTTNATLDFWHMQANWYGDQDTLAVYYKTSSSGQWTLLASYTSDTPYWTQRTITLPNLTSTYYIGFLGTADYGYGVCIDDVVVSGGGGCTPPSHDSCTNAIALNAGIPYSGTTLCATGTDVTSCADNDTADVWHSFTPATTGEYTISLCGSSFDTTLAVFSECWQGELACNDDSETCGQGSTQSELEITLNAGQQYLIRVSGYNGSTGNYLLTVTAPEIPPPDGITTYRAVVCGISDYQYLSDLSYCDDDARDIRDTLLAAGNWNTSNITVLIDSAATKAAIRTAIQNMAAASDADDFCLFSLSGHGTTNNDMSPYDEADGLDELLAAYDSYYVNDFISDDEFSNWIAALPTDKYVILLDACHSGGQIKGINTVKGFGNAIPEQGDGFAADIAPKIGVKDLDDNARGVVLTACDDDELSVENSGLQNGVFTYYLVQGMNGPADDSDAGTRISAEECYTYTNPRATAQNSNQHAQIYDAYTGELEFLGQEQQTNITISGCVKTATATPIEGVLVSANTGQNDTTDAAGFYEFTVTSPWSGTTTPGKAGWTFAPVNKTYTSITSNQTNQNFTATAPDISFQLDLSDPWMYQNLPNQTASSITAEVDELTFSDPAGNSSYTYGWEIELPDDVTVSPITVAGGSLDDNFWIFAAPACNVSAGLSDSGQTFIVRLTIEGDDFGNSGTTEKEFAIALLGDIDNNGIVDGRDRTIVNSFWRNGSAGPYTFKDCNLNCDEIVDGRDRQITNSVWRGMIGSNLVSVPCPLR